MIGNFLSSKGYSRGFIEELTPRLTSIGWRCFYASDKVWRPARFADMVYTAARRARSVSVAHIPVFSGRAFIWSEVASRIITLSGTPLVLSLHGGNLPAFSKRWPRLVRRLLGRAVIVMAPSDYLRLALQHLREDIRLVPNPIELARYEFRLPTLEHGHLIWLRAFQSIYNPTLAPRMLAIVRQRHPEVRLTMIGADLHDGTRAATERVASELGLAEHIDYVGVIKKAEVPHWLRRGDVFVNTTNIDNTPVSVIEAMACGLPVVSTNVGGIPRLLHHEQDALLVPPDDPAAFASAVSRILDNPTFAQQLAQTARRVVQDFDWRIVLQRWDDLLLEAAAKRRRTWQSS